MRGGLVSFHLGSPGACRWTGGVPSRGARGARGPDRSAGRVGAGPAGAGRGRPVGGASGPNQRRGSHSRDSSAGWAGEALNRRVSCLLWSLCPQVPQSLAQEQGLRPQGLQAGEDSRPPLFLADLGLADQTVPAGTTGPGWSPGWVAVEPGCPLPGHGTGGDRGPEWTSRGPAEASQRLPGLAGLGGVRAGSCGLPTTYWGAH